MGAAQLCGVAETADGKQFLRNHFPSAVEMGERYSGEARQGLEYEYERIASKSSVRTLEKTSVDVTGLACRTASKFGGDPHRKTARPSLITGTRSFVFWDRPKPFAEQINALPT